MPGFDGETWRKETTWKTRRRREDDIKIDVEEIGGDVEWIDLAHYRVKWRALMNTVMNLRVS
jgi:hypothetical protein